MAKAQATTIGELRESGYSIVPIKEEMRRNLIRKIQKKQDILPGILGYEESVIPQLGNAILSGQDIILLGEIAHLAIARPAAGRQRAGGAGLRDQRQPLQPDLPKLSR